MAEFPNIEELPEQFAGLARGFRDGVYSLVRSTVPGILNSPLAVPPMLLLREADIQTKFYIATQGQEVVFFFFKRDQGQRVVLDTSIQFQITPAVFLSQPLPMLPEAIAHYVVPPPFVVIDRLSAGVRNFASALSVDAGEVVLLQLPDGMLAVAHPESEPRAAWRAASESSISVLPLNPPGTQALAVFLSLTRTVGEWVASGFNQGDQAPLDTATVSRKAPVIREIFHRICEAWSRSWNETAVATFAPASALAPFVPALGVRDYTASVLLRLKPDGTIAKDDREDPFQLMLTIGISAPNGLPRSRIGVGPPDFLAPGPLHASFLVALSDEASLDETAELLEIASAGERLQLRTFRLSAFPAALVFRVKRHAGDSGADRDTDMVIYSGVWNSKPATLAIAADFHVTAQPDLSVRYVAGTQRVIYSSLPAGRPVEPKDDLIRYGLRLMAALKNWLGVLQ